MTEYSYYTDGAATMINEKGKYNREAGGWAFILLKNGEKISKSSGSCPKTTNNEMELYAIYASMKDFLRYYNPGDKIEIYSDSEYCINIFTHWCKNWEKKGWKKRDNKPIKNLELIKAIWSLMKDIEKECDLRFVKVKGHSNNQLNNEVDKLAVNAKNDARKQKNEFNRL